MTEKSLTAIDALVAEVEQLRAELDAARRTAQKHAENVIKLGNDLDALRVEKQRLEEQLDAEQWLAAQERKLRQHFQEALERIACRKSISEWGGHKVRRPWYVKVARAALADGEETP